MTPPVLHDFSLDRMVRAVEKVRERLLRATAALDQAGVPYAVIGGNAVAAWVTRVDEAAVRYTQDVDILLRRAELPAAKAALEKAGFVYRHAAGIDMFLDGSDAKARDAVHVLFEREKVRPEYVLPTPDVAESEVAVSYRVLNARSLGADETHFVPSKRPSAYPGSARRGPDRRFLVVPLSAGAGGAVEGNPRHAGRLTRLSAWRQRRQPRSQGAALRRR